MKNQTTQRDGDNLLDRLGQQHEAVALAEQALRERCQELGGLLKDLRQKYRGDHTHCTAELEVLRMGNECLQQIVAERDQQLAELTERVAARPPIDPQAATANAAEIEELRAQLRDKDALVEELRASQAAAASASFPGVADRDYEAELTEFRRQLEADRQGLNEEIQQLRTRNAELNEVAREAELQLSRERAQLARERVQLDRLREEIRHELERAERDADVRERLVAVERLKDEVAERHRPPGAGPGVPPPSSQRENGSALPRWRGLLNS
jgi:SMC interacting uncharacterized protein involved in chromosome segregation